MRVKLIEEDTKPKNTASLSRLRVSWHQRDQSLRFLLRVTFGALFAMSLYKIQNLEFQVTRSQYTIHLNPGNRCQFPHTLLFLLFLNRLQHLSHHFDQFAIDQPSITVRREPFFFHSCSLTFFVSTILLSSAFSDIELAPANSDAHSESNDESSDHCSP